MSAVLSPLQSDDLIRFAPSFGPYIVSKRSPDGAERNPGRHRRLAAIPDYAPLHPGYGPYVVITGLDPVVHADWPNVRRGLMDCRIKSGNDEALDLVMPGLVPGTLTAATNLYSSEIRFVPFGPGRRHKFNGSHPRNARFSVAYGRA